MMNTKLFPPEVKIWVALPAVNPQNCFQVSVHFAGFHAVNRTERDGDQQHVLTSSNKKIYIYIKKKKIAWDKWGQNIWINANVCHCSYFPTSVLDLPSHSSSWMVMHVKSNVFHPNTSYYRKYLYVQIRNYQLQNPPWAAKRK